MGIIGFFFVCNDIPAHTITDYRTTSKLTSFHNKKRPYSVPLLSTPSLKKLFFWCIEFLFCIHNARFLCREEISDPFHRIKVPTEESITPKPLELSTSGYHTALCRLLNNLFQLHNAVYFGSSIFLHHSKARVAQAFGMTSYHKMQINFPVESVNACSVMQGSVKLFCFCFIQRSYQLGDDSLYHREYWR